MNCIIPGPNMKVLSKAINALCRIGDELYLEAKPDHLSIRSVNMTNTAYCTFNFHSVFFSSYEVSSQPNEDLACKIPMKAVLSVFKSHAQKDKKPDFCKIELEHNPGKITFKFKYKYDIMVVRSLHLNDGDMVIVVYNKETGNRIGGIAQLFAQVLANFHMSNEDMALEVTYSKALIRNYIAGESNTVAGIRSQLTLMAGEFTNFNVTQEASITFSLKPFRAAVQFAETFGLNVVLHFETSGRPAAVEIKDSTFEANFIVATLRNDDASQSLTSIATAPRHINKNITAIDQQVLQSENWNSDFNMQQNLTVHNNNDNVINSDDIVPHSPDSPTRKRLKPLFERCYETTFYAKTDDFGDVLAPDSDLETD